MSIQSESDREFLLDLVDNYAEKADSLRLYGIRCADMSRDELLCALAMVVDRYVSPMYSVPAVLPEDGGAP